MAQRLTTIITSAITTLFVVIMTFVWARGNLINTKASTEYVDKQDQQIIDDIDQIDERNQKEHKELKDYTDTKVQNVDDKLELILKIQEDISEDVKYIRRNK